MIAYTLCWFKFSPCFVDQIWPCIPCPPHLCVCTVCICALSRWWRVFLREFPPSWSSVLETLITEQEDEDRTMPSISLCCRMDSLLGALSLKKPSLRHSAESLSPWTMASQASDARGLHCAASFSAALMHGQTNGGQRWFLRNSQSLGRQLFLFVWLVFVQFLWEEERLSCLIAHSLGIKLFLGVYYGLKRILHPWNQNDE